MLTTVRRDRRFLAWAACCFSALAGCGGGSPEKVYQNWSAAVQSGNFPTVWECLTPQARGTVLQIMVLDSDLLSADNPGAKQAFGSVFSKYGLDPQSSNFSQTRLQVTNAADYAFDLNNVLRQFESELNKRDESRYRKLNAIWTASSRSTLGASQTQGTRATAALQGSIPHTAPNAQVQAVFEKVNGQWLLSELEESGGGGAVAGGPSAGKANPAGGPANAAMPGAMPGGPAGAAMPGAMPGGPAGAAMPAAMLNDRPGAPDQAGVRVPDSPPGAVMPAGAAPPAMTGAGAMPAAGAAVPLPAADAKNMPAMAGANPLPAGPNAAERAGLGAMPANPKMAGQPGEAAKGMPAGPAAMAGRAGAGELPAMAPPGGKGGIGGLMRRKQEEDGGPPGAGNGRPGAMPNRGGDEDEPPGPNPKSMSAGPAGLGALGAGNASSLDEDGRATRNAFNGAGDGAQGGQMSAKPGTLKYVVELFLQKMTAGDYSGIDEIVVAKPKGLLKQIRDGELDDEKKEEFRSIFAETQVMEKMAKNTGSAITVPIQGKDGHVIQLSIGKEDGEFKIKDVKVQDPNAKKKR